jgi:predicted tellurium resistance membrane protein TerC
MTVAQFTPWVVFLVGVAALLILDVSVLGRHPVRRRLGAGGVCRDDDAFVAFTSNVCAILGLRALSFALAGSLQRFAYLSWGLALVLGFVGVKMLLSQVLHVPTYVSLSVIVVAVGGAVLVSLWMTRGGTRPPPAEADR